MNKAAIAQSLATVIGNLLENNGLLDDKQYLGCALDAEGCPFLIRDNHVPASFEADATGGVVFTGQKLKDAVKYKRDVTREERDVFNEYCAAQGLYNQFYFHCSSMEKAMTIATLSNAAQQFQQQGEGASREELVAGTVKATLNNFAAAVEQIDPQLLKDEDSLVQAMIAAGMTPVREQQAPIPTETVTAQPTNLENTVKKIEALPVTQAQPVQAENHYDLLVGAADTERAEKLIDILKNGDQLSNQEQELLVQLESIVGKTKARKERLTETLNDKSTIVANSVGRLLKSHLVPYGLHKRHLA